jgi:hypothetical protein
MLQTAYYSGSHSNHVPAEYKSTASLHTNFHLLNYSAYNKKLLYINIYIILEVEVMLLCGTMAANEPDIYQSDDE